MSDSTSQQVDWYIKWYNSQQREKCPDCGESTVATENADGEIVIDLTHSPDCKLHAEWTKFAEDNPGLSPGNLWLKWNHRNDYVS